MNRLRPFPASARSGFTLVELLVVMSLIILLAALAAGISQTGMFGSQKVISAGDRVSGWLLIAKQRAVRDGAPRGVRFFTNPNNTNAFTEAQYIESPDPWVPNPAQEFFPDGARIVFSYQWWSPASYGAPAGTPNVVSSFKPVWDATNMRVDPTSIKPPKCYYVCGSPTPGNSPTWVAPLVPPQIDYIGEFNQRVTAGVTNGDFLTLPEFAKNFRVTGAAPPSETVTLVNANGVPAVIPPSMIRELTLSSFPDFSAAGTEHPQSVSPAAAVSRPGTLTTYKFGFQRTPQPLLGEPTLQLTGGTAIDVRYAPFTTNTTTPAATPPYNPSTTIGVSPQADPAVPGGQFFDVLFSPSGQLLNTNSGLICLWIRDSSKGVAHPRLDPNNIANCDPYATYDAAGQQVFVVLNAKNGLISTQEIIPPPAGTNPTNYDPYRSAKDGINSGL